MWEDILKIKNNEGQDLVVKDVNNFIERLRAAVRATASQYYGKITQAFREGEPRISNINIRERYITDEMLRIRISYRHRDTLGREQFEIILKENDEGDFYYLRVNGPEVVLGPDDVVSSETKLITIISEAVARTIKNNFKRPDLSIRPDEERQTSAQTIADVERANPGYLYINQKLHKIEDLKAQAERMDISYEALLRLLGRDI